MTPEHWLNIATQGLAPQSAERVRGEYLAYLEDALEAGEAEAAVLAEWGDPHRANRDLKQAHLTTSDAKRLPAGYAPSWSGFGKAFGEDATLLGVFTFLAVRDTLRGEFEPIMVGALVVGMLVVFLRWMALSHFTLSPRLRALLHWLLTPVSAFVVGLMAMLVWQGSWLAEMRELIQGGIEGLFTFAVLLYHFYRLYVSLRAARKVEVQAA